MMPSSLSQEPARLYDELWANVRPVTSRRLLIAALECFAAKGFEGSSTREIAEGAGISPGGIYVHYRSKRDLLFEISRTGHQHNREVVMAEVARADGPMAKLRAFVFSFVVWHARFHTLATVTQNELKSLGGDQLPIVTEIRRGFRRDLEEILESGVRAGEFDLVEVNGTGRALMSLGIDVARWFREEGSLTPEDVGALYEDLALRMVRARLAAED